MDLPVGTVTFLFSDVEGSTEMLERYPAAMGPALGRLHSLIASIAANHHGIVFETLGDADYAAFADAVNAAEAALEIQVALAAQDWSPIPRIACRLALHAGEVELRGSHYFGPALFRCARLQAIGYGEQTLVSALVAADLTERLPSHMTLIDQGRHRLKDLREPEQVFMLVEPGLRTAFPALRSVHLRPNNLPVRLSSFVGRQREVGELCRAVSDARLSTLTGPGGVGKTRLALEVAAKSADAFSDGVFVIELSPVVDADQVLAVVAETLGVSLVGITDVPQALGAFLASRRLLLILDNTEQIPSVGRPVLTMIQSAPNLRVLVTSRIPLRIRGERVFPVAPLPVENTSTDGVGDQNGRRAPAVQLFLDRAAEAGAPEPNDADLAAVVAICSRLDGLPLAIELAAARTNVYGPGQLLERLSRRLSLVYVGTEDLPERQRTLRSAIAWSYDLLDDGARRLLAHLSIFVGGWTLEAAEAVCRCDMDVMGSLVDAALVKRIGPRFTMLETIREFAGEQLAELDGGAEGDRTAGRHARYFIGLVQRAEPELTGPNQLDWVERLNPDVENIRSALLHMERSGQVEQVLEAVGSLWWYWTLTGREEEGIERARRALAAGPNASPGARGAALHTIGCLELFSSRYAQAVAPLTAARQLLQTAGAKQREALCLNWLGCCDLEQGRLTEAAGILGEAASLAADAGEAFVESWARANMIGVALHTDDLEAVANQVDEWRESFGPIADAESLASTRAYALYAAWSANDLSAVRAGAEWVAEIGGQLGEPGLVAEALLPLVITEAEAGNTGRSLAALGRCNELVERSIHETGALLRFVARYWLHGIASVLAREDCRHAAMALGALDSLRIENGFVPLPVEQRSLDRIDTIMRAACDARVLEAAYSEGRTTTLDHVIKTLLAATTPEDH